MEAKLQKHGEITVVQVSGQINIEANSHFREVCLKQLAHQRVVFNLEGLQFVGSSGIQAFFRALSEIHDGNRYGVRLSGLKPDFVRILQYTTISSLSIHENVDGALRSFAGEEPPPLA